MTQFDIESDRTVPLRSPMAHSSASPSRDNPTLRRAGYVLLALYFLAGIAYSFVQPKVPHFMDERDNVALADNLLHGPGYSLDGVHLTALRPPGYSFFAAALESTGGGVLEVRIANFLALTVAIFLVARICSLHESWGALLIATVVAAAYPLIFYIGGTLYPQSLAAFLLMAFLALLLLPGRTTLREVFAGLIYGMLILTVPTFLLILPFLLVAAYFLHLAAGRAALLVLVAAGLVVIAWTARNYLEFHRFVPVASNSGVNLMIGNSPHTLPYGGAGNVDINDLEKDRPPNMDDFQADNYMRDQAVAWIKQHPGQALKLYVEKALNFFNVYNAYAKTSHTDISPAKQLILAASYVLLLLLLAWRLCESGRFPLEAQEKFFLIIYVAAALTSAIFFTRIRFRIPYDFLIVTIVAMHLSRRLRGWFGPRLGE